MSAEYDAGFCVREPAWHRMDRTLDAPPKTIDEVLEAAFPRRDGMPGHWEPYNNDVYVKVPNPKFDPTQPTTSIDGNNCPYKELVIPSKAVLRDDDHTWLSTNSDTFGLVKHRASAELAEAMIGLSNGVGIDYETGGTLKEGAMSWLLLKLDAPIEIPGDPKGLTMPYVSIFDAVNGSSRLTAMETMTRIVCWNTWQMAKANGRSVKGLSFKHTATVNDRIEQAKQVLSRTKSAAEVYRDFMTKLATTPVTPTQTRSFLDLFVPMPPDDEKTDRKVENVETARGLIIQALHSPTTQDTADTAYGLVQAAGEYLDHLRNWRVYDEYVLRATQYEPRKSEAARLALQVATSGAPSSN
jgi:phage/plasmid-like protein (TIGR03299 family)